MYNVQIILAHNKQTHCQPLFPKNMKKKIKFINKQKLNKKIRLPSLTERIQIWIAHPHLQKTKRGGVPI